MIPILDEEATANYYSVISKENIKRFSNLFDYINQENNRNI